MSGPALVQHNGEYVTVAERERREAERKAAVEAAFTAKYGEIQQQRAAERAEAEQARVEAARVLAENRERALKTAARASWRGSDEDFAAAWPSLRLELQKDATRAEMLARKAEAAANIRSLF